MSPSAVAPASNGGPERLHSARSRPYHVTLVHPWVGRRAQRCVETRKRFYGWPSIGRRLGHWVNLRDPLMAFFFVVINAMHQLDVKGRHGLPLGDLGDPMPLLEVE